MSVPLHQMGSVHFKLLLSSEHNSIGYFARIGRDERIGPGPPPYPALVKRVRILVSGEVQGVGFRWICAQEAKVRGVSGFVRNLPDGRVEAAFEGSDEAVDGMVRWAHDGPSWARVSAVQVEDEPPDGEPGFEIRH